MIKKVLNMNEEDTKYYQSSEFKKMTKDEQLEERVDRILNKIEAQLEYDYEAKGVFYDFYCDKDNPFYDTCLNLLTLRIEEIEYYIDKGWTDLEIICLFKIKIPTSKKEYKALTKEEIDDLYRFKNGYAEYNQNVSNNNNNIEKNNKKNKKDNDNDYKEDLPSPSYDALLKDLWRRIVYCIIGWLIASIGFGIQESTTFFGLLIVFVGAMIIEIPCYRFLLAGGTVAEMFSEEFGGIYLITYNDGSTSIDDRRGQGAAVGFLVWILVVLIGVFAVLFSLFRTYFKLLKIKNQENLKLATKQSANTPITVGILVFILGIILSNTITGIIVAKENNVDDYSDEETIVLVDQVLEKMQTIDFKFVDYKQKTYLTVLHDGEGDIYHVELSDKAKKDFKLSDNNYMRVEGVWYKYDSTQKALGSNASSDEINQLNKLTIKEIIGYQAIKDNIADVTVRNEPTEKVLILHNNKSASKQVMEFKFDYIYSDIEHTIRVLDNPYSYSQSGKYSIYISYDDIDLSSYLTK